MSKEFKHILTDAMSLSRAERISLVQAILEKIKDEEDSPEKKSWETDSFFQELDQRLEAIQAGKVQLAPGEEVKNKLNFYRKRDQKYFNF